MMRNTSENSYAIISAEEYCWEERSHSLLVLYYSKSFVTMDSDENLAVTLILLQKSNDSTNQKEDARYTARP